MNTSKISDDLDAVRVVVETVKDFSPDDQQRIFRWVAEKLGLPQPFGQVVPLHAQSAGSLPPAAIASTQPPVASSGGTSLQDIKSFVTAKSPRSDVQFAATVAYYFQFEAPQPERKDSITSDDLQEACRKAGRNRLGNPSQTLINAHRDGLLDKSGERGHYSVNAVGENLVAMTLPGDANSTIRPQKRTKKNGSKTSSAKSPAKKIAAKRTKKA